MASNREITETKLPSLEPPLSARVAAVVAVLLALIEILIDWVTRIELNVSIVYGLPLVVAAGARSRRLIWTLAACLLLTTFAVYYVQIPPAVFSVREQHFVNRVLAGLSLVLTASLLHVGLIAADMLDAQGESLRRQNEELDRRRREAEEASRGKTRLLASVSHDLRTPIQTINLMAEVLCHTTLDPDLIAQMPDFPHLLQANANALSELVGDVLDSARWDSRKIELQVSDFSLNSVLAEECERIAPLAERKGLRLNCEKPDQTLALRTDRVKLLRIIRNLLGNAIKFTNAGEVTVSASLVPEGSIQIFVQDTGIGIASEELPRIFDEYLQLNNADHDSSNGSGLGLAICRRFATALGGSITVQSHPGRGSRFTVSLPASCVTAPSLKNSNTKPSHDDNGRECGT